MTLDEVLEMVRRVASDHESRADRYFAYAALWDVMGYVQLCDDRDIPAPDGEAIRRELNVLLTMLDPVRVHDGHVAVQLVLARLDGLGERAPLVTDVGVTAVQRPEVLAASATETIQVSDRAGTTIVSSGGGSASGRGSAAATIVATATGYARGYGEATPTIVASDGSNGSNSSGSAGGGRMPGGVDVRSRQPTFVEAQASGMLASLDAGHRCWWEHHDYPLPDGRWAAQVRIYEDDGRGMSVTPLYPVAGSGYFSTPSEARAHNTSMALSYFTVDAPSPSKPFAVAIL